MNQVLKNCSADAYYSVQEFAELAGVSKQAVYDRIKKDLAGYTVKKGGKTMISGEALQFVGNRDDVQDNSSNFMFELENQSIQPSDVEQVENQASKDKQASESSLLLEYLMKENARLLAEIERRDALIAEKDAAISDFASRFAAIAEKEQEISSKALATTGQAQMLHAMSEHVEALDAPQEPTEAEKKRPWWKLGKGK